ncbi:peptidoglycan editing factor PgeF [Massilia norwichensis]|uniref:Purine nucleoside phosphorylase n=1 Tax=Massilia norwichensis TaxID=1442366 RepID=A0ABT2A2K7_9BURK|nr:peptidoglycan editing factor PgeF [Massilia norwichensis]MCS0588425.1 peptidoglycan editing factor PgeF [Massilia norwichensis]
MPERVVGLDPAQVLWPDWPDLPANVGALATTRRGGVSAAPFDDGAGGGGLNLGLHVKDDPEAVRENRARLQALLPGRPAWIAQVHGREVVDARLVQPGAPVQTGDAGTAFEPGVVCAILTADCLPVLFADLEGKVVGAAHAGWRGLAGGVLQATVAQMRAQGAGEITAWLGPAIGPDAFEVGPDVLDAFRAALPDGAADDGFRPYPGRDGKYLADMALLARRMLAGEGITRVYGGTRCTFTEGDRFYSYRRDGAGSGRQATLIWIK